jgi:hypothetical protein
MSKMKKQIELMKVNAAYVKAKVEIYIKALMQIAVSHEQANPIALQGIAKTALAQEPTTADEYNKESVDKMNEAIKDTPEYKLGKKIFGGDTGTDADYADESLFDESSAELLKYDKMAREDAESAWRNTVLHPEHESEYDDSEDVQLGSSIVKSNDNVEGVFMVDGEIKDVDYIDEEE